MHAARPGKGIALALRALGLVMALGVCSCTLFQGTGTSPVSGASPAPSSTSAPIGSPDPPATPGASSSPTASPGGEATPTPIPTPTPTPTPTPSPASYRIASSSVIATFAGDGLTGGATGAADPAGIGEGGAPEAAHLYRPTQVAVAPDGATYILEYSGGRIREVFGGKISTFAGGGTVLATDQPVPATQALLNLPRSLAIDAAGDIIVVDSRGSSGAVLAIARGEGFRYGKKLVAGSVVPLLVPSAAPSPLPVSVAAAPSGDLFLYDSSSNVVWRLDPDGQITKFAGSGTLATAATATGSAAGDGGPATSAPLALVARMSVDPLGNLFLAEKGVANRIRVVCRAEGTHFGIPMTPGNIYPIAGLGPATAAGATDLGDLGQPSNPGGDALKATLRFPDFLAFDPAGHAFLMDTGSLRVRRIDRATRVITTVVGTGVATSASAPLGDGGEAGRATMAAGPIGLAFDLGGNLLIGDAGNHRIRKVSQAP